MNKGRLAGYGVGSIGTGVFSTVPGLLLLFFLTDVLAVPAALAGVVVVAPKALDVLFNPIIGAASDREAVRTARRTKLLLTGALVMPVAFATMFLSPSSGYAGAIWVTLAFIGASVAFAAFQVPYVALPAEMSDEPDTRLRIMTWRIVFLTLGILIAGGLAPAVVDAGGGGRPGYALMGGVVGAVVLAACVTATLSTRWVRSRPGGDVLGLVAAFRLARGNRPFFLLMSAFVTQAVGIAIMLAAVPYVATYWLGDYSLTSILFVCVVGPSALAVPVWSALARRFGRLRCFTVATVVFAVAALVNYPLGAAGSKSVLAAAAVLGLCYAALQVLPLALMPDAIVADAARTGQVQAGAFTGAWTAGETAGLAVGPGLYALMLAVGGFLSSTFDEPVTQPGSAKTALLLGFTVVPALLMLASLPILRAYGRARTTGN
ncbi:MAG: MFS transporter [Hamadaea sp.]|uniref:MFS transporter n=1 Tax=Hamadaea sp. TaxID=2024425 RepID=UPI0017DDB67D|nr:MFS transporter [Hamadaea sp.]NUR48216.1 MFS transporter [Hamadaea sp.]NUR73300.1 MFS transporter [Hamadaea sp.]NUT21521.1 MFS transporter [Hamadaea sp.]